MLNADQDTVTAQSGGLFPIRTVAKLTGINPVTLRAWERRYNLIRPQRTPKGHRLYTEQDIVRIKDVLKLLDQGISISQTKSLLDHASAQILPASVLDSGDVWQNYQEKMLQAIEGFDEQALDNSYNDALSLYPVDIINLRLTTPLLRMLGERWRERRTGIAEEHFFSVFLRNKLGTRIHHTNQRSNGPQLLLACLPGEYHEIGLLLFALAAVDQGYRVLLLGANTPLDQLPDVINKRACEAVVLSGLSRPMRGLFDSELPNLMKRIKVPVCVGGQTAAIHCEKIEKTGAVCMGEKIGPGLKLISEILRTHERR